MIHVKDDPYMLEGGNIGIASSHRERKRLQQKFRDEIDHIIEAEKKRGFPIDAVMKKGNPPEEIIKMVKEENIDLLIMLAHEEGYFEHFLFGRDNEELIRKMPYAPSCWSKKNLTRSA